jgi:hypothetical protein
MNTKYFTSLIIATLFSSLGLFAQLDNSPFYRYQTLEEKDSNKLYLSVSHLSFNKDNEYFNSIADGYTLFGNALNTSLVYYPAKNVRLEGGVYLRKDFGNNNYSEIAPVFSMKIKLHELDLIFGTLEGSLNHGLIEPLYDFEKIMLDRNENGIQVLMNKKKLDMDFWINWEHMLYTGDSTQEKLSGGVSSKLKLIEKERFQLNLPFQFTAMHLGGQIDASEAPLTSKLNTAIGFQMKQELGNNFFRSLSFEPYYVYYKDFSFEYQDAYKNGNGLYLNLALETKLNTVMLSYWQGSKYISTHGGLLYNSRSTTFKYPDYLEPERKLLIIRFLTDIKVMDNVKLSTRFEPFFDLTNNTFEFSMGLYINYQDLFKLKDNIKRK